MTEWGFPNFDGYMDPDKYDPEPEPPVQVHYHHAYPCMDAATCDKCVAHRKRLDDAMEALMAEKHMFWCLTCKASGRKELATEQYRGQHYCDGCIAGAHQGAA